MGMGVGAAMTGLRPIVEGMNMGFLLLAFNQISNNCGMMHYTSGGQYKTPMVIRGPGGVGRQLGAEHSQRLESYFQSIPGVQLVAVSTVRNAKALLKSVSTLSIEHRIACCMLFCDGHSIFQWNMHGKHMGSQMFMSMYTLIMVMEHGTHATITMIQ